MKRMKMLKFIGLGVGSFIVVALMYLLSSTGRVVGGISEVAASPAHLVRLQIVNAAREPGVSRQIARQLSGYRDADLEIEVVDAGDFELRRLANSFVIARERDETTARMLAEKLGLEPSEVIFKPLKHNYRQVSVTLVLGDDYQSIDLAPTREKE